MTEELYFGRLGEVIKSVKKIKDTVESSFTSKWTYDNFGRVREMIYPDGEVLTYGYGKGGLLKSAIGESSKKRLMKQNWECAYIL